MSEYSYDKAVDAGRLAKEIEVSELNVSPTNVRCYGSQVTIGFASALTVEEETLLTSIVGAHDPADNGVFSKNYYVRTPPHGYVDKEEWYESFDGSSLSGLAKRKTFNWTGNILNSVTIQTFYKDGLVKTEQTLTYFSSINYSVMEVDYE